MRRQGLALPMRSSSERLSSSDQRIYRHYAELSDEPAELFAQACIQLAADTLAAHRPAFLALVDALLKRGELDMAQVRSLWQRHAEAA